MIIRDASDVKSEEFNKKAPHIIQSWQWGEFRKQTGVHVERIGVYDGKNLKQVYQATFHTVPLGKFTVGYLPKSGIPNPQVIEKLKEVGEENRAIFVKSEPEAEVGNPNVKSFSKNKIVVRSSKTIFASHTFLVDLTKSEDELLAKMHPKTRYNIRLAQKNGVQVEEKDDQKSFNTFLTLQRETARRQKFFTHPDSYYQKMWNTLRPAKMVHLLIASYKKEPLASWIIFRFKDTAYYPYGGSSEKYKNFMASNLIAWEAIRFGKKLGCETFDMWGALGENPDQNDPWYGFNRFKQGYGGKLVSYIGAYDLVLNPLAYKIFINADKLRWIFLRAGRTFS